MNINVATWGRLMKKTLPSGDTNREASLEAPSISTTERGMPVHKIDFEEPLSPIDSSQYPSQSEEEVSLLHNICWPHSRKTRFDVYGKFSKEVIIYQLIISKIEMFPR